MAMNGWADPEPAWWLNLLAHPDAMVDLVDGSRPVRGRAADEDERPLLWARWAVNNRKLDAHAALRSRQTQVVILEPRPMPSLAGTGPSAPASMPCQYKRSTRGSVPAAGQPEEKRRR